MKSILWIQAGGDSTEQGTDEEGDTEEEYNVVPMVHYHPYEKPHDTGDQAWLDQYEMIGDNKHIVLIVTMALLSCITFISCMIHKHRNRNSRKNAKKCDHDTGAEIEKEPVNNA